MLKFRRSAAGAPGCDAAGVARLAAAAGVRLEFIRAMSGDACVVHQFAPTAAELAQGLARLKQHPAVEWAEVDAWMKVQ